VDRNIDGTLQDVEEPSICRALSNWQKA